LEEYAQHLFFECPFFQQVCYGILRWLEIYGALINHGVYQ
jgi:hypothetical protein